MTFHWPQITMLILAGVSVGIHVSRNGEYRNDKYNAGGMFIATAFELWLMYEGGFFS